MLKYVSTPPLMLTIESRRIKRILDCEIDLIQPKRGSVVTCIILPCNQQDLLFCTDTHDPDERILAHTSSIDSEINLIVEQHWIFIALLRILEPKLMNHQLATLVVFFLIFKLTFHPQIGQSSPVHLRDGHIRKLFRNYCA